MKIEYIWIVICLWLVSVCTANVSQAAVNKPFKAEVVKIIDGDSLKVRSGKQKYELRLYGIDAPEYDQPYAANAKKYVKHNILGRNVKVVPVEYDKYGRLVAVVWIDDVTINEKLLREGLAWYYPKYCKKSICSSWKKLSNDAEKQKKNLWQSTDPVAPWKWKYNKMREKKNT
jgi:endonuclease YncB( thermonuclease family)